MASVPLSSLSLAHRRRPADAALTFSSSDLSFRSGSVGFGLAKKNQRVRVSVCRASSFVFRNLDADDFRHPLDKQVSFYWIFLYLKSPSFFSICNRLILVPPFRIH